MNSKMHLRLELSIWLLLSVAPTGGLMGQNTVASKQILLSNGWQQKPSDHDEAALNYKL